MKFIQLGAIALLLFVTTPGLAQQDEEGCKDHPLFTRFPNMHINDCKTSQFDMRKFPVGPPKDDHSTKGVEVEGPTYRISYVVDEGMTPPSGLQIMRNFQNAAKKAGASIEGEYPGWCKAQYDTEYMPDMGNGCTSYALTMKFPRGNGEAWVFMQAAEDAGQYTLMITEREQMKQEISVNELTDKLTKEGFVTLYINFDTGKATIKPDSTQTLDDAAAALKGAPDLRVEVGGHTDNVGTPEANQKLSQDRAEAVMAALVQRGIKADRLAAKGYGQTSPIADNRTEEGRTKNRRVELVKK